MYLQVIEWLGFEDVDYESRATSLPWKSFCKSWRWFSQNWKTVSWIQCNRWEGETLYLGNQVRDDTNGAHHEAEHKWVSCLNIVLQTIKIYIPAPSRPKQPEIVSFGAIWLMYISMGDSLGLGTENINSLWIWKNSTLTGHCKGQPQASGSKLKPLS